MNKDTLNIENARLVFRNFAGKEGKFNNAGNRNFCVLIDELDASQLEDDGWNIKRLKPRDENEAPQPYIQVSLKYNDYPPKIILITSKGQTTIGEEEVGMLDWAEIKTADVSIRPYNWEVNGKTGCKAYLKALYVTLEEDAFESKYSNVPDSAQNTIDFD